MPSAPEPYQFLNPGLHSVRGQRTSGEGVVMNKGGFSWRRLLGISATKSRISRTIGIPLTRSGRQRKIGRMFGIK